jgi:hypothetical protein
MKQKAVSSQDWQTPDKSDWSEEGKDPN